MHLRLRVLEILVITAVITAGSLLIHRVADRLDQRMQQLRVQMIELLEQKLQRRITYGRISPSVFGFLAIHDLTIYSFDNPEEQMLRISKVQVYYNIFRFLATRDPMAALSGIQIANSSFEIDYERDQELLRFVGELAGDRQRPEAFGSLGAPGYPGLDISGTNISLSITKQDWRLELSNLFFSLGSGKDYYQVDCRGVVDFGRQNGGAVGPGASSGVSSRVRVRGRVDRRFTWSDLAVNVFSLSTGGFDLKRQTMQVSFDNDTLKVSKIEDRSPLDIQILYDLGSRDLSFQFNAEGLKPGDLIQFRGALSRYNPYLSSSITSRGRLAVNLEKFRLSYSADLQAALPPDLLAPGLTLEGRLAGDEKVLYVSPLRITSAQGGELEFRGDILLKDFYPSGSLTVVNFQPLPGRRLSASFEVARSGGSLVVQGGRLSLDDTSFESMALTVTPGPKQVEFTAEASLAGEGGTGGGGPTGQAVSSASAAAAGGVQVKGRVTWGSGPKLELEGRLDNIPVLSLCRLAQIGGQDSARLEKMAEPYMLSLAGKLSTDFSDYEVSADRILVRERANPANFAQFLLDADRQELQVNELEVRWEGYHLTGALQAELEKGRAAIHSLVTFESTPYELMVVYRAGRDVQVTGSYGLKAAYTFRGQGNPLLYLQNYQPPQGSPFRIQCTELPIPLKHRPMYVSMDAEGLVSPGGAVYLLGRSTRVRNLPVPTMPANSVELSYVLKDKQLTLERVLYQDAVSSLTGSGKLELTDILPLVVNGSIELQAPASAEHYRVDAEVADGTVKGRMTFTRSPLTRMGELALSGDISGAIQVEGALRRPRVQVDLTLLDGRLNADPVGLDLSVVYTGEQILLQSLNASFLTHRLENGSGSFDLETGKLTFASHYRATYFQKLVELDVTLDSSVREPALPITLPTLLGREIDGSLRLANVTVDKKPAPEWNLGLKARQGVLSLDGGPQDALHATLASDLSFTVATRDPLPIRGSGQGRLERGRLDCSYTASAVDLRIINTMIDLSSILVIHGGTARGTIRFHGAVNDPDWTGALQVSGAQLTFIPSPDEVGPVDTELIFEEKTFSMVRTVAKAGKAKVEAEGTFYLDHWVPEAVEILIYVNTDPGVHIRYTFGPMSVDGYGTGAVRVTADAFSTGIQGKAQANSCRIALQRTENGIQSDKPPAIPLSVDLKITTGRSIEFYWPTMTFPVLRTYAKQGEQVQVFLNEDTGEFYLKGGVEIRGGEVFYFDRSFYLKRGKITFEERIDEFDPWIEALAEIRERDLNNEEIKIYLEANNKLSQFSPRFYSEPSRPDVEILNMIGGPIVSRFEQTDFGTAAMMLTTDIIGQFGILTPFERAVREVLNLDLFSIRTQFLQNVLLGKLRGENWGNGTFNPLDNTTLSLGKYLGTDLFLEALVRFQAVDDITRAGSIRTEGELNLEWATPFFLLEWTFTPAHPESLFLPDNSIGLSWKYSY
jgi:translocation and assembly module TamB